MPHVNRDMRREPVAQFIFRPIADRSQQTQWEGKDNINASVVDPLFQKQRELNRIVGTIYQAKASKVGILCNEVEILAKHAQTLPDHLDARLSAFFRQLVDVYDTPSFFVNGKVEDQLESSKTLTWVSPDGKSGTLSFESAHYGTLPCIIAYPRVEYTAWLANPASQKPQGYVFNKYSDTYRFNNACAGHLKIVNEADSLLDWKSGNDVIIRPFALELLNASAKKELDPFSGMRFFIAKLNMAIEQLLATKTEPSLQFIFQTYKGHLATIQEMLEQRPHDFFTLLLGIEIDENDPLIQKLRDVIYPHRFKTLQTASGCQSQIAARVEIAKQNILNNRKKPNLFDKAFKARLILDAHQHSEKMSQLFQRHFCMNKAQAEQLWDSSLKPAKNLCLSQTATTEITALFSDISKLLHNYSVDVSLLRANLLRQIRELNHWSQTKVATKINDLSPQIGLYQQQVSRLELGEKKITDILAELFGQIFNVHHSIFISDAL